ncbi:MAG: arsenate reductase family protein, partial [Prolixibacteraceae bacterium]
NKGENGKKYRAQEDYYDYIKNKHHVVMDVYHNPRCAKSRAGLKYLEEKGYEVDVRKYMTEGISEEELRDVIGKTGSKPYDFVRTQEKLYKENYKDKEISDDEWYKILAENPRLLKRPIVVNAGKAVLADPPENLDSII